MRPRLSNPLRAVAGRTAPRAPASAPVGLPNPQRPPGRDELSDGKGSALRRTASAKLGEGAPIGARGCAPVARPGIEAAAGARLGALTMGEVARLGWREDAANPVIRPSLTNPIIGDPTFLTPNDSPDGKWHLYAYTVKGIVHHLSSDGVHWSTADVAVKGALRPFLVKDGDTYTLLYEKPRSFLPAFAWLPWESRIEARTSTDLVHWSEPTVLLEPSLPWHSNDATHRAVGNPNVVRDGDGWRLYYSAGLSYLPDAGFAEPRFIGSARAKSLLGPYTPDPRPQLGPKAHDPTENLGAGSMKVLPVKDGWVAFQNTISEKDGVSRSELWLLGSTDGTHWKRLQDRPLLAPSEGWKASHIYAVDVKEVDGRLQLYFNARDDFRWWKGHEAIGVMRSDPLEAGGGATVSPGPRLLGAAQPKGPR